jgi:ankyrin repeat protein
VTPAWSRPFGFLAIFWALFWTQPAPGAPANAVPLLAATLDGDVSRVKSLLADGVDPDILDDHRNTALIYAARDGETEIAELLLEAGADAGWIDGERVTPLILAFFKGHLGIVYLLLARQVDRTHRDQWGRTALDYALRRGNSDPIAILLQIC